MKVRPLKVRRSVRALAALGAASILFPSIFAISGSAGAAAASDTSLEAREVRTVWTNEFGVAHPVGLAYAPGRKQFLVAGAGGSDTSLIQLDLAADAHGKLHLPPLSAPDTLAFDPSTNRLTAIDDQDLVSVPGSELSSDRPSVRRSDIGSLGLGDPRAATFDPSSGAWFVFDRATDSIVVVPSPSSPSATTSMALDGVGVGRVDGIAFNPADGLVYALSSEQDLLYALDTTGTVQRTYGVGSIELMSPMAMTFAPSADRTDSPSTMHLYVADAGTTSTSGGVTEMTLAAAATLSAPTVTGTLVQVIPTSAWNPGSPDPSGIEYMPGPDRLEVCDSEVEEVTGAGYHGVNLWTSTRTGTVTDTGTTYPAFSKEPTGLGYDPGSNTLFISDDSAKKVWVERTGPDNRFGTSDDVRTFVDANAYGSGDTEDPEYDPTTGRPTSGHLFFLDGVNTEVYDVNPVDGIFGNGNDTMTHFDVGQFGPTDWEGLGSNPANGNLLVGARATKQIFEVTPSGTLVRVINLSGLSSSTTLRYISGLQVAPASDGSGRWDIYIVDRNIDNGSDPNENDGRIVEVSVPSSDNPPTVSLTNPSNGATVSGTINVQATASDDQGVMKVDFFDGATLIGTDTNGGDGWSSSWNTTAVAEGSHTLKATATDTANQTSSSTISVTVDNLDNPPSVSITSPSNGASVSGTISVQANASDDRGVTKVEFFDGATSIGVDTTAGDGWSASWNTTSASDGSHSLTAVATDTGSHTTTSAAVSVTVDNLDNPPSVSITSPSNGASVSGTITIQANASDDRGVTKVEFFDGATSIGVDTTAGDGWSASWNTTSASAGSHSLTAVATDTTNQSTTSAAVSVAVDNTAPTVAITLPTAGQTVTSTTTVQANAADNTTVGSVMFLVDGSTLIGTDTNGADGWSVSWNTTSAGNGIHSLTAVAADVAGNSTTSSAVSVTVSNVITGTLDIPIATSLDDVEEINAKGTVSGNSTDLDMVLDKTKVQPAVGLRFVGVGVPQGATISAAYVQFLSHGTSAGPDALVVTGQASDNAPAFTTAKFNVTSRLPSQTNAQVNWSPPDWASGQQGLAQRTFELNSILQEIVGRSGWVSGNAVVLIITGSGTGTRVAEAFDSGRLAPTLHIEYTAS